MRKGRMKAFSDGVLAIVITIMVLELRVTHGVDVSARAHGPPVFSSYVFSFIFPGIYWNNHHLLQAVEQMNGSVLWANLHLLFWFSQVPFVTGWMEENNLAPLPVELYGVVLIFSAMAYYLLTRALLSIHDQDMILASAIKRKYKEVLSLILYAAAIPLAFLSAWIALALYITVAVIWFIPDRRIETVLTG